MTSWVAEALTAPEWDRAERDVVEHLERLIRFRTVNPPGNELPLAEYVAAVFGVSGIDAELIETAPGRGAVRACIPGAGVAPPLLLLAHGDVVPADAAEWTIPPFAGVERDGYVYGRGAIDDKGMLAVNLVTMVLLARALGSSGATLARDVVFLVTPDEEVGSGDGIEWIARHRPEWLQAEYALNEGGRIRVAADGRRTLLLQYAEKTPHAVTITAHGGAGHAGVPRADNAVLALGRALAAISDYASDPVHGVSPTMLHGSEKSNVIPARASAQLDVRTRPSESVDAVVATLRELVRDPNVAVEVTRRGDPSPPTAMDTPFVHALSATARDLDPAMAIEPYLSSGATDGALLRRLGVATYGLLPFPLTADDEARMHGADERVPVSALRFGLRLVYETVLRVAGGEALHS